MSSLQLNLRTICRGLRIGFHVCSAGVSNFLKPTWFITLFVLTTIVLQSGDIETNPGQHFQLVL